MLGCGRIDVVGELRPDGGPTAPDTGGPALVEDCGDAARVFGQALCACGATIAGGITTSAPAAELAGAAHVQMGGELFLSGFSDELDGDLVLGAGAQSVVTADGGRVAGSLYAPGALGLEGVLAIAGDAYLAEAPFGSGELHVGGALSGPGSALDPGQVAIDAGQLASGEPARPLRPCACDGAALPIGAWVAAVGPDHPDLAQGFDPGPLSSGNDTGPIELPPGLLRVDAVDAAGDLRLRVRGRTTVFVAGDLRVGRDLIAELGRAASLSLFVAGAAEVAGTVVLGDPERPASGRLYVAGPAAIELGAQPADAPLLDGERLDWVGNIYAPQLSLRLSGRSHGVGALHVGQLTALGGLSLVHAPSLQTTEEVCGAR